MMICNGWIDDLFIHTIVGLIRPKLLGYS